MQLMSANQRLYQAEQTSATAVANAAQLQGEVLRLSNQMDELRLDLQTQSTLAETQQVCTMRPKTPSQPCMIDIIAQNSCFGIAKLIKVNRREKRH